VALPWSPGETLADRLCATIHDEILMMVENEHAEWARGALETVMVNAAYKVLGHRVVPIAAEGKIGPTWPK
jgi:DNA polymerase I-like protein with 3'-5' exonuclease and polymerase domains